MGLSDFFSTVYDGVSSAFSTPDVYAEEQQSSGDSAADPAPEGGKSDPSPTTGGASTKTPASGTDEESGEEADANKADAEKAKSRTGGDDDGAKQSRGGSDDDDEDESADAEEEEEEEEEEEPEDIMPKLHEQCAESKQCAPAKHHFDECAERVQGKIDADGQSDEDCVEEFFHLAHCASQCAAPKLFRQLK